MWVVRPGLKGEGELLCVRYCAVLLHAASLGLWGSGAAVDVHQVEVTTDW